MYSIQDPIGNQSNQFTAGVTLNNLNNLVQACYHLSDAPAYSEKNWGSSFPQKWFWLNCNSLIDTNDLAITAGGVIRQVLWWDEEVALIRLITEGVRYII